MQKISFAILSAILLSTTALFGCESKEEVKSVTWYKAPENKAALEEKLAWCRSHKEKQGVDQNCINAESANALGGSFEKVKELKTPTFGQKE